jgi:phosphoribosyl-AMP cyclohydrolase
MNTDKTLDERIEDFVFQGNYYWEESKNRYWAKNEDGSFSVISEENLSCDKDGRIQ